MADFQNGLISRIFCAFSSGFLHTITIIFLYNYFFHVFESFSFGPKLTILEEVKPVCGL